MQSHFNTLASMPGEILRHIRNGHTKVASVLCIVHAPARKLMLVCVQFECMKSLQLRSSIRVMQSPSSTSWYMCSCACSHVRLYA